MIRWGRCGWSDSTFASDHFVTSLRGLVPPAHTFEAGQHGPPSFCVRSCLSRRDVRNKSEEHRVGYDGNVDWPLAGVDVRRMTMPAGLIETRAARANWVSMHVGPPVAVECVCDGAVFQGIQAPGCINLTPAGAAGRWVDSEEAAIVLVAITPMYFRETARIMGVDADVVSLTPRFQVNDPQLSHIVSALALAAVDPARVVPLYLEGLARSVTGRLVSMYSSCRVRVLQPQELSSRQKRRVVEYIEGNLADKLGLADIARIADVSVSHFKTLFRQTFGLSVHQYVIQRRVEQAARLIGEQRSTMSDIAAAAGFAHQSHLARCMRRVLGVTLSALARSKK